MSWQIIKPLEVIDRSQVPVLEESVWIAELRRKLAKGFYPVTLFGKKENIDGIHVWCVLANPSKHSLWLTSTRMKENTSFPSLTDDFPAFNNFECELFEQTGIFPEQHPALHPVRTANVWRKNNKPYSFYHVEGEEVHEVAVGPVHAGVIEPGHFRFQCHGEQILNLETMFGYQHRGVEDLLPKHTRSQQLILVESIAGDSVIAHATAFCAGLESLGNTPLSLCDHTIRGIAAELERVATHLATLGGIATDIGFVLPAAAFGNLRTLVINLMAEICGSRFGRGWIVPGGVRFDLEDSWISNAQNILKQLCEKFLEIDALFFNSPSTLARLEEIGVVTKQHAQQIGMVGTAARASGLARDIRIDFPYGVYRYSAITSPILESGDVYARVKIRSLEILNSIHFILEQLQQLPSSKTRSALKKLRPNALVISLTEGHRGEIAHILFTDTTGNLSQIKIKDPSFHNWQGLSLAIRENEISDFPLCNKSFDLSYAGYDL